MSNFYAALPILLQHEGFWSSDPADPGGATKYGISLRFLKSLTDTDGDNFMEGDLDRDGDIDVDDIRVLKREHAVEIYKRQWWDRYSYDKISNQELATKIFDLSVNMGPKSAHKCCQRALRAVEMPVKVDGILGPVTLGKINMAPWFPLLASTRSEAACYYRQINYDGSERFLKGWLNRAYS